MCDCRRIIYLREHADHHTVCLGVEEEAGACHGRGMLPCMAPELVLKLPVACSGAGARCGTWQIDLDLNKVVIEIRGVACSGAGARCRTWRPSW
jgi:hypothetical protein